jgi:hypothetical protein
MMLKAKQDRYETPISLRMHGRRKTSNPSPPKLDLIWAMKAFAEQR